MKKQLAICDCDERYRSSMQNYLMKKLTEFEVITFRSLSEAIDYSKKQTFAIFLLGEHVYEKELQNLQALQIFILREDGEKQIAEYPYLEKYQSMETLIREILTEYAEHRPMDSMICRCIKKTKLHVFYSPVKQRQQIKAAMALGQILVGSGKRVLYLNLQAFSGWEELETKDGFADITDLLYFADRQESNLFYRIQSMKQTSGGVDYFAPAEDFTDLLRVSEEEWTGLLDKLLEAGKYTDIIWNLSEICQGFYRILEKSDCVYSMCGETREEQRAIEQYQKLLAKREMSSVPEKTKWIEQPLECMERDVSIEWLGKTALGKYMKGLVQEDGNRPI